MRNRDYHPVKQMIKINKKDKQDEVRAMKVARIATACFTLLGVLAVYAFNSYPTVYQAHAFFHATLTPPLMVAIFFGAFWKKFTPAGLITTVIGGISLMLLGNRYPQELIGPIAHGTPFDPVHPYTYMDHGEIHTSIKDDLSGTVDMKHQDSDIWDHNEHHGEIKEGMNSNSMEDGIKIDSDHDGFSDEIEEFFKTDSGNIASHPLIVMPKHYTIWDQAEKQNLDGTFDSMKDIDPA